MTVNEPETTLPPQPVQWLGLHVVLHKNGDVLALLKQIPGLANLGINLLIGQINYHYEFLSHPELHSDKAVTRENVKKLVHLCRQHGIRLIPEFNSLGHQSWGGKTYALLEKYPQFDETPGKYPCNWGIYCRSWCALHPGVNKIIFDLYDELIDVFEADALHVGMDEVFLIGSEFCPRCRGKDPALLFAKAVNDAYEHIVKKRGKEMLMWGDRLLDGKATGYGEWEASMNKTFPAIDMIPKDIIICDWHYETRPTREYPSVALFLEKGFRVLPAGYRNDTAVRDLIDYSLQFDTNSMLGYLCTTWSGAKPVNTRLTEYSPLKIAASRLKTFVSSKAD